MMTTRITTTAAGWGVEGGTMTTVDDVDSNDDNDGLSIKQVST